MNASIIIIGDEILCGQVTDTNSGDIARALSAIMCPVVSTRVVGDNAESISKAIDDALKESELVVTTGGLGPTKDDITKQVICRHFGMHLVHDAKAAENVERVFAARGLTLNDSTRSQAMVPDGCEVVQNLYGTAPVMWIDRDGRVLVSMPGVPFETKGMLPIVIDKVRERFIPDTKLTRHTLIISGITESDLSEYLSDFEDSLPKGIHLAYLPVPGFLRLRLDGINADDEVYYKHLDELKRLTQQWLIHDGDATPAEMLIDKLRAKGLTVSSAESCTGGNIAHSITSIAGCSDCYVGSVVSYANEVKEHVLGVSSDDLCLYGAVSEPVVRAMAEGVARITGSKCSMATSGIAGPGGGTPDKPVGTVWMAVHVPGRTISFCKRFPGDRSRVIERATTEAMLRMMAEL